MRLKATCALPTPSEFVHVCTWLKEECADSPITKTNGFDLYNAYKTWSGADNKASLGVWITCLQMQRRVLHKGSKFFVNILLKSSVTHTKREF